MSNDQRLSRITLYDKVNASTLALVTSEMSRLNEIREETGYSDTPTYTKPPEMDFQFADVGGVRIRYARSENPDKPTLVMLAPFPQSILAYAPIWSDLADKFNLFAFDMPGFGRSGGGVEFMTFEAQGRYLNVLLQYFNIDKAHLLGPDVGMPAIIYYVGKFSSDTKSIIVGDGPAISPSSNASVIRKMVDSAFWRMIFRIAGAGALVEAGRRICYVNYTPNEVELSDYKKSYSGRVSAVLQWFKDYPSSLETVDPLLDEIDLPTLIFWGDEDAILFPDNGERVHQRMKNSELKIFRQCGHFCYQDRAQEFTEMVIDWIGRND
jgi:pimeloyl-ACP methyl ester carboxylesterase